MVWPNRKCHEWYRPLYDRKRSCALVNTPKALLSSIRKSIKGYATGIPVQSLRSVNKDNYPGAQSHPRDAPDRTFQSTRGFIEFLPDTAARQSITAIVGVTRSSHIFLIDGL